MNIAREKHPDKYRDPKDHEEHEAAKVRYDAVVAANEVIGTADEDGHFARRVAYDVAGERLREGFQLCFGILHNNKTYQQYAETQRKVNAHRAWSDKIKFSKAKSESICLCYIR